MGGIMSGNPNCKKHENIAKYKWLDSYSFNRSNQLPRTKKGKQFIFLVEADKVTVTFRMKGAKHNTTQTLIFDFVLNNYGGQRTYFLCPFCSERIRKLYLYDGLFRCRKCAGLNYPSQQVTKGCNAAYLRMRKAVRKLDPEAVKMSPHDLSSYRPERPKYMHHNTYYSLLGAFYRSQNEYDREWMKAVGAILGRSP